MASRAIMTRIVYSHLSPSQLLDEAQLEFARCFPREWAFLETTAPDGYQISIGSKRDYGDTPSRFAMIQVSLHISSATLAALFGWRFWELDA